MFLQQFSVIAKSTKRFPTALGRRHHIAFSADDPLAQESTMVIPGVGLIGNYLYLLLFSSFDWLDDRPPGGAIVTASRWVWACRWRWSTASAVHWRRWRRTRREGWAWWSLWWALEDGVDGDRRTSLCWRAGVGVVGVGVVAYAGIHLRRAWNRSGAVQFFSWIFFATNCASYSTPSSKASSQLP